MLHFHHGAILFRHLVYITLAVYQVLSAQDFKRDQEGRLQLQILGFIPWLGWQDRALKQNWRSTVAAAATVGKPAHLETSWPTILDHSLTSWEAEAQNWSWGARASTRVACTKPLRQCCANIAQSDKQLMTHYHFTFARSLLQEATTLSMQVAIVSGEPTIFLWASTMSSTSPSSLASSLTSRLKVVHSQNGSQMQTAGCRFPKPASKQ